MTGYWWFDIPAQLFGIWCGCALMFFAIYYFAKRRHDKINEESRRLWSQDLCRHPRYSGHGFE